MTKLVKHLMVVCMVVSFCGSVSANFLLNGGFEDGDLGQLGSVVVDNWTTWGTNGWHANDAGYYQDEKSIKMWWDATGVFQDFSVTAGEEYILGIRAISPSSAPLKGFDGILKIEWFDASLANLGGQVIDRFIGAKDASGITGDGTETWIDLSGTATAASGAVSGRIVFFLEQADGWASTTGGELYWDNASAVLVPEPTTLVVLGIGSVLFLRRKK